MATKKQIAANRRNAKKSTGPRTAAGKAAASHNATKHGLLARRVVLADEDAAAYEEARLTLVHELWPETPLEQQIVGRIAAAQWRLARVPVIEAELLERLRRDALGRDEGLGAAWARDAGPYGGALTRLARYEAMLERNAARLLAELRRAQAERRAAENRDARQAPKAGSAGGPQEPWWERAAALWPGAPAAGRVRAEPPRAPTGPLAARRRAKFPNEADALTAPGAGGLAARRPGAER